LEVKEENSRIRIRIQWSIRVRTKTSQIHKTALKLLNFDFNEDPATDSTFQSNADPRTQLPKLMRIHVDQIRNPAHLCHKCRSDEPKSSKIANNVEITVLQQHTCVLKPCSKRKMKLRSTW